LADIAFQKELESEGYDKSALNLPETTGRLIAAVLDANSDAIIVTQSGAPVNVQPWVSQTTTLTHMWVSKPEISCISA
jgi:Glycosyl hydrolase family 3 C terminal domain.